MIKLNGENTQKAWEDYKEFLDGMGGYPMGIVGMEQAFKMGFAMGEANKNKEVPQPVVEEPTKPKYIKNRKRTEEEIENDARLVASIMQRKGEPMRLQDITEAVNAAGGQWYDKSASGHMNRVMERYPTIKKVGFGLYHYER
jgi:hypothetical protein